MFASRLARALPIVSVLPQTSLNLWTYGYAEGAVYDISNVGGLGSTPVTAFIFEVQCQEIVDLEQVGNASVVTRADGTRLVTYPIHVDPSLKALSVSPGARPVLASAP